MTSSVPIEVQRQWMYNRVNRSTRSVTEEFEDGLRGFMEFGTQVVYAGNTIFCPCKNCENRELREVNRVWKHLYNKGFMPNYFVWTAHGEELHHPPIYGGHDHTVHEPAPSSTEYGDWNWYQPTPDSFPTGENYPTMGQESMHGPPDADFVDAPNEETAQFFKYLHEAKEPLYKDCIEGLSKFSFTADMMSVKTSHNVAEETYDAFQRVFKHALPVGNVAAATYYEAEKLMQPLSMPHEKIDVCLNNCMIYWNEHDKVLLSCKFCGSPRYKPVSRSSAKRGTNPKMVAYKSMWYFPISPRLKRLYLSKRTAVQMRWHAEHDPIPGMMQHPAHGIAWKHFNNLYPDFASESRNVYLGLSTDGFNPFGTSGGNYSLWPVILTPYNLPPEMCMKKEFLFLNALVSGPNHPKRSLDVFLEPLIEELKELWYSGHEAYDVSDEQIFTLRAALLWTISDFPAYGMLSGWTTHGKLACPFCMEDTEAFGLRNGRKISWFDCHRRHLPANHGYRKNREAFRANKVKLSGPPTQPSGFELDQRLTAIPGLQRSRHCGGNGHMTDDIQGYGGQHNWHKHSIFWELPYWSTHLLRHNLDVMHIEKNFFDNIHNTIFNVSGKTKDSLNSRKDIALHCSRPLLHLTSAGRAPVPIFRLLPPAKKAFMRWIKHEVKFPDGYVSNVGRCINEVTGKMHGLKSHDSHVMMQRIYPFAFTYLLTPTVHKAISDVGIFFRDLTAKTLRVADVDRLQRDVSLTICNMEKIFPPAFFDVMEHLPVHLPSEARLGGPVQFRWMYPFERFMFDLKKKAKNKARVEGSIASAYLLEEITNFTSRDQNVPGTVINTEPLRRHAAGFLPHTTYEFDVPEIFRHVGSPSGGTEFRYLNTRDKDIAHTYILLNCPEVAPYERWYDEALVKTNPDITEDEMRAAKQIGFSKWLLNMVHEDETQTIYPLWLHDLAKGPIRQCRSWNRYFCRGYNFHTISYGEDRATANYGICVRGEGDSAPSYYGTLQQVLQITYDGAVGLKVTLFRCDWYDTTPGTGTRMRRPGVVEVYAHGAYREYDPFVLSTQADQVCFLGYPRVQEIDDNWLVVVKVSPRGLVNDNGKPPDAAQADDNNYGEHPGVDRMSVPTLVVPEAQDEDISEESDDTENDEYDPDVPLTESEYSGESDSE